MSFVAVTIGFCVGLLCRAMSEDLYAWLKARMAPAPSSINVLESGVVLPDPDDPRWKLSFETFTLRTPLGGRTQSIKAKKVKTLRLGDVVVCMKDREVYIDTVKLEDTLQTLRYVDAVQTAYCSRLALASITEG